MTELREAAQQALEALLNCPSDISDEMFESIRSLKAALAEPVQEPVAWMHVPYPGSGLRQMVSLIQNREPSLYAATVPLYVAPPQRKPLTEEEIRDLWSWAMTAEAERTATTQQHAFARAVERAHGITP
jgi:isocitrate dehydrogenase